MLFVLMVMVVPEIGSARFPRLAAVTSPIAVLRRPVCLV
jgi:hypothetical protein